MEENKSSNKSTEYTEEISLRELIEVLLDYKFLIAAITLIVVVSVSIFTYMVQDNKYTAKATLSVKSATTQTETLNTIDDIIDFMNDYPIMTVESYVEQILTPQVLHATIRELELKNDDGDYISIASLTNKIEVANIEDTNLITIKTTDKDPEVAAEITNAISSKFIAYTNDKSKVQSQLAAVEIEKQLILEEVNVEEKSKAVAKYLAENVSIEELSNEVNSLIGQVTSTKAAINGEEVAISRDEQALEVLLNNTDLGSTNLENLELNLSSGNVSNNIDVDISNDNNLQSALLTMEITNTETRLISNRASKEANEVKLSEMQEKLIELQTTLAEQEYKFSSLTRDLDLAKQTYNAYQSRHKEAIVATAANIGSNSVYVSSEALVPAQPVSPNRMLNMMIGLVLGLMIGVFVAFFKAYWENSK